MSLGYGIQIELEINWKGNRKLNQKSVASWFLLNGLICFDFEINCKWINNHTHRSGVSTVLFTDSAGPDLADDLIPICEKKEEEENYDITKPEHVSENSFQSNFDQIKRAPPSKGLTQLSAISNFCALKRERIKRKYWKEEHVLLMAMIMIIIDGLHWSISFIDHVVLKLTLFASLKQTQKLLFFSLPVRKVFFRSFGRVDLHVAWTRWLLPVRYFASFSFWGK